MGLGKGGGFENSVGTGGGESYLLDGYAVTSGIDTYTASVTPAPDAYEVGQTFRLRFTEPNTGSSTININSLGALTLLKGNNWTLDAMEIVGNNVYTVTIVSATEAQIDIFTVPVIRPSDQTTTSATAVNMTGASYAVKANATYRFTGDLHIGCNNTGGVRFAVDIPASATVFITFFGSTTANTAFISLNAIADGTLTAGGGSEFSKENSAARKVRVSGEVTTGASAGTVQFQFASGTAGQTSSIFNQASFINVERIA
jgi:hypothetical protein